MITLLSNSPLGVCEWSVSEEVEIEKIDKRGQDLTVQLHLLMVKI